jgi:hypothetical protein
MKYLFSTTSSCCYLDHMQGPRIMRLLNLQAHKNCMSLNSSMNMNQHEVFPNLSTEHFKSTCAWWSHVLWWASILCAKVILVIWTIIHTDTSKMSAHSVSSLHRKLTALKILSRSSNFRFSSCARKYHYRSGVHKSQTPSCKKNCKKNCPDSQLQSYLGLVWKG